MSLAAFQCVCVGVLVVAYAFSIAATEVRWRLLGEMGALAAGAWIGEQTVIGAYRFYHYAPGWWAPLGDVPLLVVLIWPMVVLSAREVVRQLWPALGGAVFALAVGGVVVFDASLIETVAVASGFWSWVEGGYLDVPLVGILGWGCYAMAAGWLLDRRWGPPRLVLTPVLAVAVTHCLILGLWWGALRWVLRGSMGGWGLAGFAPVAIAFAAAVLRARARGRTTSWATWVPRALAATAFLALLPGADAWIWCHVALSSVPYLCALPGRVPSP